MTKDQRVMIDVLAETNPKKCFISRFEFSDEEIRMEFDTVFGSFEFDTLDKRTCLTSIDQEPIILQYEGKRFDTLFNLNAMSNLVMKFYHEGFKQALDIVDQLYIQSINPDHKAKIKQNPYNAPVEAAFVDSGIQVRFQGPCRITNHPYPFKDFITFDGHQWDCYTHQDIRALYDTYAPEILMGYNVKPKLKALLFELYMTVEARYKMGAKK